MMWKKRLFSLSGGLLLTLGVLGCAFRTADLTMITTEDVALDSVDLDTMPAKKVTGKDSAYALLFIPFGIPSLENAVDDALQQGGGNVMLDAVVTETGWLYLPMGVWRMGIPFGKWTIEVKGDVVKVEEEAQ